ncbi:MAG: hypothetical protein K6T54_07010 [Ignavibacterium sp.]|nr:hypothetical protein [Ignavibacterium sp.]
MVLTKEQIIEKVSKQPIISQTIRKVKTKKGTFYVVETRIQKFFSKKYLEKVIKLENEKSIEDW